MCRLLGAISKTRNDAEDVLLDASRSLLRQSRVDRKRPQRDGWGIGWIENGRTKIVKSPNAVYRESGKLRRAARRVKGKVLIGHIRWASNPMKLPKRELIGLAHTQPFTYGPWIFAHNGTLLIPKEVRAKLGPLAKQIKGNNDSEVLFYWLLRHLRRGSRQQIARSLRRSLADLDRIWKTCRSKYPLYKYSSHGLNVVLTNGKILVAMCYVNPAGFGKAKALVHPQELYYQLRYKQGPDGWIVSSEPLDDDPHWTSMRHGQILITNGAQGWLL